MTSRESLVRLLRDEIELSGHRQYDLATATGVTPKHLSQTLNGATGPSLDLVDAVLAECGRRLVLATAPLTAVPSEAEGRGEAHGTANPAAKVQPSPHAQSETP